MARRPAEAEVGGELLDLVHRHVVGHVHLVGELRRELHRGVHRKCAADVRAHPRALQQRRRLDRAATHEHVRRGDRTARHAAGAVAVGDVGRDIEPVVDQTIDPRLDEHPGAGGERPRQVGAGHALALAGDGVAAGRVLHPARDLAVAPVECRGTTTQDLARRGWTARNGGDVDGLLDLVGDRFELVDVEALDAEVATPPFDDVERWAEVETAVHLGAAAGAPALGVRDRRQPERHGDTAGSVLAVHLVERERGDRVLVDPGALFDDQHVEAGLGQQCSGGGSTGAGSDDEHLRADVDLVRFDAAHAAPPVVGTASAGAASSDAGVGLEPSGRVSGQVSKM